MSTIKNKKTYSRDPVKVKEYLERTKERRAQRAKEYRAKNLERLTALNRETTKKWYQDNREDVLIRHKEYYHNNKEIRHRYYENNLPRYLLSSCRRSARDRGLDFNIDENDLQIPAVCPIMKTPFTTSFGRGRLDTNPSVDRIDSSKGYIKGNVQVISWIANAMKSKATKEQLVEFAQGILELYGNDAA